MKQKLLLIISLFVSSMIYGQVEMREGEVMGNIAIGNKEVTAILDKSTGCVHKTDLHKKGMFLDHEQVQIKEGTNNSRDEIIKPEMPERVFINEGCGNSDYSQDLTKGIKDLKIPSNRRIVTQLATFDVRKNGEFLEFGCINEAKDFIIALEDAETKWIDEKPEDPNSYVVPNELMDYVENAFGHDSYRKVIEQREIEILKNSAGKELSELEDPNPDGFITDEAEMLVFNDKLEVMIDGNIFKQMDKDNVAIIGKDQYKILGEIRGGADPRGLEDVKVMRIPSQHVELAKPAPTTQLGVCGNGICEGWACEDVYSCDDCKKKTTGTSGNNPPPCITDVALDAEQQLCEGQPNDVVFTLNLSNDADGDDTDDIYASILIGFGDGTEETRLFVTGKDVVFNHTYAEIGTYEVSILATHGTHIATCFPGSGVFDVTLSEAECFHKSKGMKWETFIIPNSSNLEEFRYRVKQVNSVFSSRIVAETEFFRRKSANKALRNKKIGEGNILHASLIGPYYDKDCAYVDEAEATLNREDDNNVKARDTNPKFGFGTRPNEIVSTHWVEIDGIQYPQGGLTYELDLNPCEE